MDVKKLNFKQSSILYHPSESYKLQNCVKYMNRGVILITLRPILEDYKT